MRYISVCLFIIWLSVSGYGATWIGGEGDWHNPANWSPQQLPTLNDFTVVDGNATVHIGNPFLSAFLGAGSRIGYSEAGPTTVSLEAGALQAQNDIYLGTSAGTEGRLEISGGVYTGRRIYCGWSGNGIVQMTGGEIILDHINVGLSAGSECLLDIRGGVFRLNPSGTAIIGQNGPAELAVSGSGVFDVHNIYLGYTHNGSLHVSGGEVRVVNLYGAMGGANSSANIHVTGGRLLVQNFSFLPHAAGGTINIELDGGVFDAGNIYGSNWSPFSAEGADVNFNINGGKLILNAFVSQLPGVTAYHGAGVLHFEYDPGTYSTIITAENKKGADNPWPWNGSAGLSHTLTLTWEKGDTAVYHKIYLSEDYDLIDSSDPAAYKGSTSVSNFTLTGLLPGRTYYWKVDELEIGGLVWPGQIWSFRVAERFAEAEYFVSPDGEDTNSGSIESPFKTPRQAVKTLCNKILPGNGVAVYLREGEYFFEEPLVLEADNGAQPGQSVTFIAYPGEKVIFSGGVNLDPTWFTTLTSDSPVWSRLDTVARGEVKVCDLPAHGITNFGNIVTRGTYLYGAPAGAELFFNDEPMPLGRWPNSGYAEVDLAVNGPNTSIFKYGGTRPERWLTAEEVWYFGYWYFEWAVTHVEGVAINTTNRTITLERIPNGGIGDDGWYYAYNLLEEIDMPGEWYLNRTDGKLYFWPPANLDSAPLQLTLSNKPLVSVLSSHNLCFNNIIFELGRDVMADVMSSENIQFKNCLFRNCGTDAVALDGYGNRLEGCEIYGSGDAGACLTGGNRFTLRFSNSTVNNCHIHDFSRWNNLPGISLLGAGLRAEHNLIHHAPMQGIRHGGNNNVMQFNEIHHICLRSSDNAAIYSHWPGWDPQGAQINYNFLHHLRSNLKTPDGVVGIYQDNCASGATIKGNIIYDNAGWGMLLGGGRDNKVHNNIIVKNNIAFYADARGVEMAEESPGHFHNLLERLVNFDHLSEPWSSAYPWLSSIPDNYASPAYEAAKRPAGTELHGNLGWQNQQFQLEGYYLSGGERAFDYISTADNLPDQDPLFVDEANLDMNLHPNSPAFTIPGFEPIPFDAIGLQDTASHVEVVFSIGCSGGLELRGLCPPWAFITSAVVIENEANIFPLIETFENGAIYANIPIYLLPASGTMTVQITIVDAQNDLMEPLTAEPFYYVLSDITCDGEVNYDDIAKIGQYWDQDDCGLCGGADLSGDRAVGFADVVMIALDWLE